MFKSIKNIFTASSDTTKWENPENADFYKQLKADFGLKLVSIFELIESFQEDRIKIDEFVKNNDWKSFIHMNDKAYESGEFFENGVRRHSLQSFYFFEAIKKMAIENVYKEYKNYNMNDEFFAPISAIWASRLESESWRERGSEFIEDTAPEQIETFEDYLMQATAALEAVPSDQRNHRLWHEQNYMVRAVSGSFDVEQLNELFEKAWRYDRYTGDLCATHGYFLLPRWNGENENDLEVFAQKAAQMTQDVYGDGMYAMINGGLSYVGELEVSDLAADPERIEKGFEDMLERFPTQSITNYYAAYLAWNENNPKLFELLKSRMRVIVKQHWTGDTPTEIEEDALISLALAAEEMGYFE